jgi:hypothetical protein
VAGANPLFVTSIVLLDFGISILTTGLFIQSEYKVVTAKTTRPLPRIAAI